jgi:predicted Zn-dependent protease
LLRERLQAEPSPAAGRYVSAVRAASARGAGGEVLFAPTPEPLALTLPDRTLVLSSGTIAALEDEAQLAFILAREESLVRQGWVARRFRGEAPAAFWSIWRRRETDALERAIESSCLAGFGTEAEPQADGEGLAALVAADYDPQAGARALALLDRASRGTARFRLSRIRSRLLARALADAGRPAVARLNREVYRRALAPLVLGWN